MGVIDVIRDRNLGSVSKQDRLYLKFAQKWLRQIS